MDDPRETDLFGHPVRKRKGLRGRPARELTSEDLDALEAGLTKGWSQERIAGALDIGLSTLKRNFGPILKTGSMMPDRLQLALFAVAVRKALEGDMGAVRQVRQMVETDERRRADERVKSITADNERVEKLGKKEAARRASAESVEQGAWDGLLKPGYEH